MLKKTIHELFFELLPSIFKKLLENHLKITLKNLIYKHINI